MPILICTLLSCLPIIFPSNGLNPESLNDIHQQHHFLLMHACALCLSVLTLLIMLSFLSRFLHSIQIGPPNSSYIKSKDKSEWTAKDVADSVLADRSSLRVTSSQRLEESSVLNTHSSEIDGEMYWYYEYLVRKAPLRLTDESSTYRHYLASTAERDGYLYSISASTVSPRWEKLGPFLDKAVSSFRLLSPTENYVPPYKDPWRFW
uniref:PsbP C-terminal domain-containing protein n=1 Tax=Glycine max TaxID=3847 RepID=I1JUJ3_SOYBN